MAIQLELDPVVEGKVAAQAAAEGLPPAEFAYRLIVETVAPELLVAPKAEGTDVSEFMERLVSISRGHVVPTGETYSREMLYADQPQIP
jgi:hypothetical protein